MKLTHTLISKAISKVVMTAAISLSLTTASIAAEQTLIKT